MRQSDWDEFLKKEMNASLRSEDRARLDTLLSGNPESQSAWTEEVRLNELLRQLPDAPLSTNFTSQVLNAVEAERRTTAPREESLLPFRWRGWSWATRSAFALSVLLTASLAFRFYESAQLEQVASSVAAFSDGVPQPMIDILAHFDEIKWLPSSSVTETGVDADLLAAIP